MARHICQRATYNIGGLRRPRSALIALDPFIAGKANQGDPAAGRTLRVTLFHGLKQTQGITGLCAIVPPLPDIR
ncbi:hypothetical protein D3C75_1049390 [compost metagenome]